MGGVSLPQSYDLAVRVENCLIQAREIALRPPMPFFPDIQSNTPLIIPPFAPIPVILALQIATTSNPTIA